MPYAALRQGAINLFHPLFEGSKARLYVGDVIRVSLCPYLGFYFWERFRALFALTHPLQSAWCIYR